MTELQMGLIGLGAVAVVAVVAYNKWQEMRQRKQAEEILNSRHPDVLFGEAADGQFRPDAVDSSPDLQPVSVADDVPGTETDIGREPELPPSATADPYAERIEPVWRPETEAEAPLVQASMAVESTVESRVPAAAATAFEGAAGGSAVVAETPADNVRDEMRDIGEPQVTEPLHLLSPFLDYVASFEAVEPAPAYQILQSRSGALARIRKPVQWVGYNEFSREWEPIVDDGRNEYRRLRVGVQLVDRQGALGDGDLSVFHIAMQELADELMAIVDLPPRQPALNNAAKIDEFCASVDIQIGINVISQGQPFAGTKLRALAEAAGMVIDAEGRFVRCDEDGAVLYTLINQDEAGFSAESMKTMSTHGLTFLLDVPRVAHGDRVFNQMVELARRFAEVLRGALVDDNRRPLSESALEPIRRQIAQYQSMMAAQSIPAGAPLTRRLFS
jgi:hypothetical protein